MIRLSNLAIGVAAAALFCSCRQSEPGGQAAMVVDLEAVAKATGRDVLIANKVEAATQDLNAQLIQAAQEMEKELKKQQAESGSSPTEEQRAKLRQTAQRIQQNIQNNKEIAEQARQRVRNEHILLFRREVKPIAARIAARHRAAVVLIADQDVVWFAPSADITAEMIAELRTTAAIAATNEPPRTGPAPLSNAAPSPPPQGQPAPEGNPPKRP
jgi:Skp family chaperone for outer membrane proteins